MTLGMLQVCLAYSAYTKEEWDVFALALLTATACFATSL